MNSIFIALGSNLGDKEENIELALNKIEKQIGKITSQSAFYYSKPVGFESDNIFVNSVCEVLTNLDIYTAFARTQAIEKELGRSEKSHLGKYNDRIINIDLLLVGSQIIDTPLLTIPHPKFHLRKFVLNPLSEIAPNILHPILKQTIQELKDNLSIRNNSIGNKQID